MTKVSRNLASIGLGDVGSRFLGFLATAYLARVLQAENFGLINLGLAILGYMFLVTSPGIQLYGARLAAQAETFDAQYCGEILGLRAFLALVCTLGAAAVSVVFSGFQILPLLIFLYALSLFPMALNIDWFFQGKENMQWIGWSRVATNLAYALFLVLIVHEPGDIGKVPLAFLIGNCVGAFMLFVAFTRNYGRIHLGWKFSSLFKREGHWFTVLKRSLPMGFGAIMSQVSFNFPPIFLGLISTVSAVGYFAAASRVIFFLMIFDRLVTTLLLPAIARLHKVSSDQLQPMLSFVLKMIVAVALPICVGGVLLADRLMFVIYGDGFASAIPVFQWLIWYFFLSASSSVYVYGLIGIGQEQIYSKAMLWGTVMQIASIVVCALMLDAVGAAAGYALGEAILLALLVSRFKKFVDVAFVPRLLKPLIAAVMMGILLLFIRSHALSITIPLGAAMFFLALFFLRGFTKEEIGELKAKLL